MAATATSTRDAGAAVRRLVVGMGKTGYSLAAWLAAKGYAFDAIDSRDSPPYAEAFRSDFPGRRLQTGGFDGGLIETADEVLLWWRDEGRV